MKTENEIVGELIMLEKYRFVNRDIVAEVARDTYRIMMAENDKRGTK